MPRETNALLWRCFCQVVKDLKRYRILFCFDGSNEKAEGPRDQDRADYIEKNHPRLTVTWNLNDFSWIVFKKWKCLRPSVPLARIIEMMQRAQDRALGEERWRWPVTDRLYFLTSICHHLGCPTSSRSIYSFWGNRNLQRLEGCKAVRTWFSWFLILPLSTVLGFCIFYWRQLRGSEQRGLGVGNQVPDIMTTISLPWTYIVIRIAPLYFMAYSWCFIVL